MSKPIIAIDIDDVIADSTDSLRLRANKKLGLNLDPEHYKVEGEYWGYYERVWQSHGVSADISLKDFDQEMVEDQFHVPLMPGASYAIGRLLEKYKIVLITARDFHWEKATREWLDSHFGKDVLELHIVGNRQSAKETKGEACIRLGANWLIDDNPAHCVSALKLGVKAILFGEYGWHYDAPNDLKKCKTWQDVLEYFSVQ